MPIANFRAKKRFDKPKFVPAKKNMALSGNTLANDASEKQSAFGREKFRDEIEPQKIMILSHH